MSATRFHRTVSVVTLALGCGTLLPSAVSGDAVTDWNAITLQAILVGSPPPHPGATAALDIAMVHVAIYDAVEAIDRRFQTYHVKISGAAGSPAAAAATAAHDVLVNRFPAQAASLDMAYQDYLSNKWSSRHRPWCGRRPTGCGRYHQAAGQ
jgi:hypothetical protein